MCVYTIDPFKCQLSTLIKFREKKHFYYFTDLRFSDKAWKGLGADTWGKTYSDNVWEHRPDTPD